MRIGNQTIIRNYTGNLGTNLVRLNNLSEKVYTERRFSTMSENAALGVRAMQLRRAYTNNESYTKTAKTVKSQFTEAETQMRKIAELATDISVRYENALNGTNSTDEHEILAQEIEKLRDQILACANGQFSDRYLFGGTNTSERPFTVDNADGALMYNGIKVSEMIDPNTQKLDKKYEYLLKDAAFVDLGMGIKNNSDDLLNEATAFKSTMVGLEFLGVGKDNIYDLCNQMILQLREQEFKLDSNGQKIPVKDEDGNDMVDSEGNTIYETYKFENVDRCSELLNKMITAHKDVTIRVTALGSDHQYLDYTVERLEDEKINLAERQNDVEFVDPAEAIMHFKMQEYVYNACLQMGQSLLQPTLFNFIN